METIETTPREYKDDTEIPEVFGVRVAAAVLDMRDDSVRRAVLQDRLNAEQVFAPVGRTGYYLKFGKDDVIAYRDARKRRGPGRRSKKG